MTMRTGIPGARRGRERFGHGAAGVAAALACVLALGDAETAAAGSKGYVPFTADGPRIERVEARRPCARPGDTVRAVGRYLGAVSVYAFGEGSRRDYRRQLTVVRRDDRSLVLRLPADVPHPQVRLVIRYAGTGSFAPRERAPAVRICAPARESGGRAAGAAGRLGSALGGRAAVDSARAKVPTTPRTLRPDLLRPKAPSVAAARPGRDWAAPGIARAPDARTRAAGAAMQDLMRVQREGARGTVRVREVRLENPRLARDRWKEWQPVVVLENTSRTRRAAVELFVWGGIEASGPRPRRVSSLGWKVLEPGQRMRVPLRRRVTWTDCVRVWLGGRGARNPVRGTPTGSTPPAGEACKGDPPRWRVVVQAELMEVIHDGDSESPTMWHMCLTLEQVKECSQKEVWDGAKTIGGNPIATFAVSRTYASLRGVHPKAVFRVVDRDSFLAGGSDDVARMEIPVWGLAFRSEPGDALRLRESVQGRKIFHRIGDSTKGPSGRLQYRVLYEPVE